MSKRQFVDENSEELGSLRVEDYLVEHVGTDSSAVDSVDLDARNSSAGGGSHSDELGAGTGSPASETASNSKNPGGKLLKSDSNSYLSSLPHGTNSKRRGYIEWNDYFMSVAFLSAKRSKDPVTQVGACIVNADNRIVGIGYNGMPTGCSDDTFPWGKKENKPEHNKFFYVCHAEMNAIMNKNSSQLQGCRMFTSLYPCNECAKLIIQSGIKKIIYASNPHESKDKAKYTQWMLDMAGVQTERFQPKNRQIIINFDEFDTAL